MEHPNCVFVTVRMLIEAELGIFPPLQRRKSKLLGGGDTHSYHLDIECICSVLFSAHRRPAIKGTLYVITT